MSPTNHLRNKNKLNERTEFKNVNTEGFFQG